MLQLRPIWPTEDPWQFARTGPCRCHRAVRTEGWFREELYAPLDPVDVDHGAAHLT